MPFFLRSRLSAALLTVATAASGLAAASGVSAPAAHATTYNAPIAGNDISWPNCPKGMGIPSRRSPGEPMPSARTGFVVLGLTNGPGFHVNPCIGSQVAFAKSHHILTGEYAMTTFPTASQQRRYGTSGPFKGTGQLTKIRNAAYAEAKFNVATAKRVGLTGKFIWVDVEDYPVAPWTSSVSRNRAAIQGVLRGYADAGWSTGIYSIVAMWNRLTGSWRVGLPLWDSAGATSKTAALARCTRSSFTGGRRLLTQWWINGGIDHDVTCPGTTGTPSPRTSGYLPQLFVRY